MAAEANPDEKLIQLYVDLAITKSLAIGAVAGPSEVARQAIETYGISKNAIGELDELTKAQVGSDVLRAYFRKEDQLSAKQRLADSLWAREQALSNYLIPYIGCGVVIRQVAGKDPVIFSRRHDTFVREARGRINYKTQLYPYENIFFDSYRWRIQTASESYAPVLDEQTHEPLIAIERID